MHNRQSVGPSAGAILDEASLMAKLHELAASDPPLSLQLAREALVRFPNSPNAPEFEWNIAKSLAHVGRFKEAQDEARIIIRKYPETSWAADVQRHLLSIPPNPSE
jgi:outer membrane protein assembly factor BamD (BamD/ComL family)